MIREDFETQQPKIKLYKHPDGTFKGDALISYWKEESVDLALELLNQSYLRPKILIHVEKVNFFLPL
jgi:HIV Tat-specific factor 1